MMDYVQQIFLLSHFLFTFSPWHCLSSTKIGQKKKRTTTKQINKQTKKPKKYIVNIMNLEATSRTTFLLYTTSGGVNKVLS